MESEKDKRILELENEVAELKREIYELYCGFDAQEIVPSTHRDVIVQFKNSERRFVGFYAGEIGNWVIHGIDGYSAKDIDKWWESLSFESYFMYRETPLPTCKLI